MKAIQTQYKGYRFRSRLEARYAVLFDSLKITWDYEPEGYVLPDRSWYLPDFFLRLSEDNPVRKRYPGAGYWVEIKALEPTHKEREKMAQLCGMTKHHGYFFSGPPDRAKSYSQVAGRGVRLDDDFYSHSVQPELLWSAPISCCAPTLQGCGGPEPFHSTFYQAVADATGARFEFGQSGAGART